MAIDWQQHWDDLNARQQAFLLLVYERECEEASQKAISDPRTKGGEWRWQEHGIVGGAFKQALAKARIPAVSDLGERVWQAGYKDQGVGATYALLEARGWLERRYAYRHHPLVGPYQVLEVRLTHPGRKLAGLHSACTQRPPGERWHDDLHERVETLLHSPQPCRDWLHSLPCEATVGDAPSRRNGVTPLNAFLSAQRLYGDMVQIGRGNVHAGPQRQNVSSACLGRAVRPPLRRCSEPGVSPVTRSGPSRADTGGTKSRRKCSSKTPSKRRCSGDRKQAGMIGFQRHRSASACDIYKQRAD